MWSNFKQREIADSHTNGVVNNFMISIILSYYLSLYI